jgi:hypothetical protein
MVLNEGEVTAVFQLMPEAPVSAFASTNPLVDPLKVASAEPEYS